MCDDANTNNLDACTNACALARCGDGFKQGAEVCDDGDVRDNHSQYDKCNSTCTIPGPHCGDGYTSGPEDCDGDGPLPHGQCTSCMAPCDASYDWVDGCCQTPPYALCPD